MKKNTIEISSKHKKQLLKEFDCSLQAVQMSLDFIFNSKQAEKIRLRAVELMKLEIEKVETLKID